MAALDLDSKTSLATECEPSHIVNLRGSLKPISSVKWKRDSWMSHLYGTILKPSHTNRFTDWWTSSLRDTLASRSLPQENEQEKKTLATSGLSSQAEFGFFDQECVFSRTSKDTLASASEKSLENWNQWVTKCRGEYSLRVKLAHLINASECLSWPTSNARDWKDSINGTHPPSRPNLSEQTLGQAVSVAHGKDANWPTPCAMEAEKAGLFDKGQMGQSLSAMANRGELGLPAPANPSTDGSRQGSWTPQVQDSKHSGTNPTANGERDLLVNQVNWATPQAKDHKSGHRDATIVQYKQLNVEVEARATGKLNPRWVETLMGLPVGWVMPSCKSPVTIVPTNSDCLETELSQPQQSEHSELF
jgi:hypothetical protein